MRQFAIAVGLAFGPYLLGSLALALFDPDEGANVLGGAVLLGLLVVGVVAGCVYLGVQLKRWTLARRR